MLLATWVVLSGKFDLVHLGMGLFSSFLVAFLTRDFVFEDKSKGFLENLREAVLFPLFFLWLTWEIFWANLYVLKLAFHPRLKDVLDPQMLEFEADKLDNDYARYILASSITLTPGTVTVQLKDKKFLVHAITREAAAGLPSPMQDRVAQVFSRKKRS